MSERGAPRLRPAPAPLDVDLHRIMAVGTVVWATALVLTGVLALLGHDTSQALAACVAGIGIGLYGMRWARRHRVAPSTAPGPDLTGSD